MQSNFNLTIWDYICTATYINKKTQKLCHLAKSISVFPLTIYGAIIKYKYINHKKTLQGSTREKLQHLFLSLLPPQYLMQVLFRNIYKYKLHWTEARGATTTNHLLIQFSKNFWMRQLWEDLRNSFFHYHVFRRHLNLSSRKGHQQNPDYCHYQQHKCRDALGVREAHAGSVRSEAPERSAKRKELLMLSKETHGDKGR